MTDHRSAPHYVRRSARPQVKVTLTCGHRVLTFEKPYDKRATFHCTYGTGCGYKLRWVGFLDETTGFSGRNPDFPEEEE